MLLTMVPPLHNEVVVSSILLSAGTYLFDFGSNLVVLFEYSKRFMSLSRREAGGVSTCDATCRHQTSELAGYFYALLAILACCHSLNAILFKLKFTHRDAPLCAAYFLPLIHLYRLSQLVWRTLSCAGVQDLRSPEMNGLYCILGSAMEGVPMLILQFCGYLVLTREGVFLHSMSRTFKVSVAASLISAAYNGGTSVQSIAKNAVTLKQKIAAGTIGAGFTLCSAVVRCLTFIDVIVYIREYFSRQRTVREQAKFHASDTFPLLVIAGSVITYSLHFWLLHSPKEMKRNMRDLQRLLGSLSFSYMSTILGPLYPMISLASDAHQLGCCNFRFKLLTISLLHVLLDVAIVCVTFILGTLPTVYLIMSALCTAGYLGFLAAYIRFDACCGPERSSSMSAEHGDGYCGGEGYINTEGKDGQPDKMRLGESLESVTGCREGSSVAAVQEVHVDTEFLLTSPTSLQVDAADDAKESRTRLSCCLSLDRRDFMKGVGQRGRQLGPLVAWSSLDRNRRFDEHLHNNIPTVAHQSSSHTSSLLDEL